MSTLISSTSNAIASSSTVDHSINTTYKYSSLSELLINSRAVGKTHTHVLLGKPFGNYMIDTDANGFWDLYNADIARKRPIYMAETPGKESPVLVDVDLKMKRSDWDASGNTLDADTHIYSRDQVVDLIRVYQDVLDKILINLKPGALTCVLLEKKWYNRKINGVDYVKNGFHLHFPKIFVNRTVQEIYIIPIVLQRVSELFSNITSSHDFIDANSVNVHWLMYGSTKPDNTPYTATACFDDQAREISFDEALGDYILPTMKNQSQPTSCRGRVVKLLPRILSTIMMERVDDYYYDTQVSVNTPIVDKYAARKENRSNYDQMKISANYELAKQLLALMSIERADDRAGWLHVGFCLWNITNGDDEGLSLWLEFSESSEKFSEVECIHLWGTMRENRYTIATLKFFAKQDNPIGYEQLSKTNKKECVDMALDGSHNNIAHIMYNDYGSEFVCADISSKAWYRFKNHIWTRIDSGADLRERISASNDVVIRSFADMISDLQKQIAYLENDDDDDQYNRRPHAIGPTADKKKKCKKADDPEIQVMKKKITAINKIIKDCKSSPFKSHVMTECAEMFRDERIIDMLDKDPYLIAFKNGVYDFANDIFRAGKPEDYISVALPIEYEDYGTIDHPKVMEVEEFFRKIFPDDEVRNYFLNQVCQVFVGGNQEKQILFWTGSGDNGKSVTQLLFEKMLGRLAIKFDTTLITGKKSGAGCAAPELARSGNGVRWAVLDEPNRDEWINAGFMKLLTGQDSYFARDLYEKGKALREIIPMFKLHMLCNTLPGIRDGDMATWNRIKVIPFESTFVSKEKCPTSYEEQMEKKIFPMDDRFNDKIPSLVQPLAWYLIQRWKNYDKNDRFEPEKVKSATKVYKQENDTYLQYIQTYIADQDDASMTFDNLLEHFRDWYKHEYPHQVVPMKPAIKQQFNNYLGNSTGAAGGGIWKGKLLNRYGNQHATKINTDGIVSSTDIDANPLM